MSTLSISNLDSLRAAVGREIGISDWHVVDQCMINAFAALTGDRQWIHVDPERARQELPQGRTLAHGFLTLSLMSQLHAQAVHIGGVRRVINYGLNRVRFPAPVLAGARIRSRSVLVAIEEMADSVQLTWKITIEVEGQAKPALVAEWLLRYFG